MSESNVNLNKKTFISFIPQQYELCDDLINNIHSFFLFDDYDHDKISRGFKLNGLNSFIITKDNSVYGFGQNSYGVLGLGHNNNVLKPEKINELCNNRILDFKYGFTHCLARTSSGDVFSFGKNISRKIYEKPKLVEISNTDKVIDICCGGSHSLALTISGSIYAWGDNKFKQCGESKYKDYATPIKVSQFKNEKITQISCGVWHSMALTDKGKVYSWGRNNFGQLGFEINPAATNWIKSLSVLSDNKSELESSVPQIITIESNEEILFNKISCSSCHSLILSTNGDIYSFGGNQYKQLGFKNNGENQIHAKKLENTEIQIFTDICCLSLRSISTALTKYGKCYVWGDCGDLVEIPKEVEYKSCEDAIFQIKRTTARIFNLLLEFKQLFTENIKRFEREYKIKETIGRGTFGEVYKVTSVAENCDFAIKRIDIDQFKNVEREINILKVLESYHIVKYINSWIELDETPINKYFLYVEMELCLKTLKELQNQIETEIKANKHINGKPLIYYITCELLIEILEGVNYLHNNNVIHRDLKPQNILIADRNNGCYVRIADFGLSRFHDLQDVESMTRVGTTKYCAPEILQPSIRESGRNNYDHKVDIYSIGIIIEDLLENFKFYDINDIIIDSIITDKKFEKLMELKENLVSMKSDERPNCETILRDKNNWSLSLKDLIEIEGYQNYFKEKQTEESMDKNFHLYFIRDKFKRLNQILKPIHDFNCNLNNINIDSIINTNELEILMQKIQKLDF